ncbi:hypothetical protein NL676_011431 [Syzygium grande]|nr:hypothetical protein NL676_011431 [Syzygium grande]
MIWSPIGGTVAASPEDFRCDLGLCVGIARDDGLGRSSGVVVVAAALAMAAPFFSTPFQPYVYQSPQDAVIPFQILGGEAQVVQIMLKSQESCCETWFYVLHVWVY